MKKKEVKKCVIKGKVVDEKKQPLPGVTVRLVSTTVGMCHGCPGVVYLDVARGKGTVGFLFRGF